MTQYNEYQQACIQSHVSGNNLLIEAVAGSGKTTTIMGMFQAAPERHTVSLTYSRALADESRQKLKRMNHPNARNLMLKTIHSYISYLYAGPGQVLGDDYNLFLKTIISTNRKPNTQRTLVDVLIVDEMQDFCQLYFEMLIKVILDITATQGKCPQLCFVGDRFQCIYDFFHGDEQADSRYLTAAQMLYGSLSPSPWKVHMLQETFRLNDNHARFLNNNVLMRDHFRSNKHGPKVTYLRGDPYRLMEFLRSSAGRRAVPIQLDPDAPPASPDHYTWDEVMVLAQSVKLSSKMAGKRDNPIAAFVNAVSHLGVSSYHKDANSCPAKERMANKMIAINIWASKGMERRLVIVYADAYGKNSGLTVCDNVFHVAFTRATDQLVIVENSRNGPLPFLRRIESSEYLDVINMTPLAPMDNDDVNDTTSRPAGIEYCVTDLLRFQPSFDLRDACSKLTITKLDRYPAIDGAPISVTTEIHGKTFTEEVSVINGIVINYLVEYRATGQIQSIVFQELLDQCAPWLQQRPNQLHTLRSMSNRRTRGKPWINDIKEMTLLATCAYSVSEQYFYKLTQVGQAFDWLEPFASDISSVLEDLNDGLNLFEVDLCAEGTPVHGRCDVVDAKKRLIYELKFTTSTTSEHRIQAGLYHMLARKMHRAGATGRLGDIPIVGTILYNVQTGERELVQCDDDVALDTCVNRLVHNKQHPERKINDDEFRDRHSSILNLYKRAACVREIGADSAANRQHDD